MKQFHQKLPSKRAKVGLRNVYTITARNRYRNPRKKQIIVLYLLSFISVNRRMWLFFVSGVPVGNPHSMLKQFFNKKSDQRHPQHQRSYLRGPESPQFKILLSWSHKVKFSNHYFFILKQNLFLQTNFIFAFNNFCSVFYVL